MRALLSGWRNVITPWTFVFHKRTASFGNERTKLVQQGMNIITKRYPDYEKRVEEAFSSMKMTQLQAIVSKVVADLAA